MLAPRRDDGASTGFIAVSAKLQLLRKQIGRIAPVDSAVLITGESGTGKEVVAREIYHQGTRRQRPFVPVNCGAIPETLVENEFFGHTKGAFTHAIGDSKGLVERADGGVLFLDEIGEMPLAMQVRLLRFLDSGEFRRVGDPCMRRADVRVIAATNRPLRDEIAAGRFRLDLFYRLSVITLHVPPLRERRDDIPALAHHYLLRIAHKFHTTPRRLSSDALRALEEYDWPGNVRELQNVIESAAILATQEILAADDLRFPAPAIDSGAAPGTLISDDVGRMTDALRRCGGNQTHAAAVLGISRTTLWRRRRRLARKDPTKIL